jgi:hypothetical protein
MADQERDDTERRVALKRFQTMREETTDPLAARLMSEVIGELEADMGVKPAASAKPRG